MCSKREGDFSNKFLPNAGSLDDEESCAHSAQDQTISESLLGFAVRAHDRLSNHYARPALRSDSGIRGAHGTAARGTKVARPFAAHAFLQESFVFPTFSMVSGAPFLLHGDPPCETEDSWKRTRSQGGTFVFQGFSMVSYGSSTRNPGSPAEPRPTRWFADQSNKPKSLILPRFSNGFRSTVACPSFGVDGPAWQIAFPTTFYKGLQHSRDLQGAACFPLPVCCTLVVLPQPSPCDMQRKFWDPRCKGKRKGNSGTPGARGNAKGILEPQVQGEM